MLIEERLAHDQRVGDRKYFRVVEIFVHRGACILEHAANARILGSEGWHDVRRYERVNLAAQQQAFGWLIYDGDFDIRWRLISRPFRRRCEPRTFLRPYTVVFLKNTTRPKPYCQAVLVHADFLSFEIFGPFDSRRS